MNKFLNSGFDYFIPKKFYEFNDKNKGTDSLTRARILCGIGFFTGFFVFLLGALRNLAEGLEENPTILANYICGTVFMLIPFFLKHTGKLKTAGVILLVTAEMTVLVRSMSAGGIMSGPIIWSMLLPMGASFLISKEIIFPLTMFTIVLMGGIYLAPNYGFEISMKNAKPLVNYISMSLCLLVISTLAWVFESQRERQAGVIRDNEKDLAVALKMSSIGIMSAGVAHEINNPLHIIKGNAELIDSYLENIELSERDPEKLKKYTSKIYSNITRISNITEDLLVYNEIKNKTDLSVLKGVEVEKLIDGVVYKNFEDEKIVVSSHLKSNFSKEILYNDHLFEKVLSNLISNACDAASETPDPWVKIDILEYDNSLAIEVTDSGRGIPEEAVEKIFDPFYTTKDVGSGTGLGLGLCRGILELHNGELNYKESSKGNTQFVIEIPWQKEKLKLIAV